jgi:transposase
MSVSDPQLRIVQLERELQWAHLKIQVLEEKLRQQRIRMLGPQSETLSNLQLELLADEEPSATSDEVEAEARREAITRKPSREHKPHPGRERLPESLPRVEKVIRCEEQTCRTCGQETSIIGYDESEQLDVEPARYFVQVIKREKRACRGCEQSTVTMAPLPPRIVEKGLASDNVVIHGGVQVLRPLAAVSAGRDPGTRSGTGDWAGDPGWLGDARGGDADSGGAGDAQGSVERGLSTG